MNNQRQILLQSIATTISDYRQGEIFAIDENHVDRWVNQFGDFGFCNDEQIIILNEMNQILKSFYFSRNLSQEFLTGVLTSKKLFGCNTVVTLKNTKFLKIQRKGNSQNDLLNLCNSIIELNYKFTLNDCGESPTTYVYLDDCLYSGNTVLRDVMEWIPNAVRGTALHLIFFAIHTEGLEYAKEKILSEARKYDISIKFWFLNKFSNSHWNPVQFDCFWSSKFLGDEFVDGFVEKIKELRQNTNKLLPDLFRPNNMPIQDRVFSSASARNLIEEAFMKVGSYIASLPKNSNSSMKPLGYDYFHSLGFGAIFVNYHNISNNCPLALWWGDPKKDYPLSAWYPLFPRKVNAPKIIT